MTILKLGSKGEEVRKWQAFLRTQALGVEPDGDFGEKTLAATKAFQKGVGLKDDGIVGPETEAKAKTLRFAGFDPEFLEETAEAKTILISAGHSTVPPRDPGAVGNGHKEADLAVELRDMVASRLRGFGMTVIEDGEDGENQPLKKAIALAKTADVAIEFHWNAGPPAATGIEVLAKTRHKALAREIALAINKATGIRLRGDMGYKPDDSGQHHRLGFCEAGGLIVEVCFISSVGDMTAYKNHKDDVAQNIAVALAR